MIQFEGFVDGHPVQQGSLSPIPYLKKNGRMSVAVFQKKPLVEWRNKIANYIKEKYQLKEVPFKKGTPVYVELTFSFVRPKSVSEKKRPGMTVFPDLDKCVRSFGDSATGILYDDDSQIVWILAKKIYSDQEGVFFQVRDCEDPYR